MEEQLLEWARNSVEQCKPPDTLSSGDPGRQLVPLLAMAAQLKAPGPAKVFGLECPAYRADLYRRELLPRALELIEAWRVVLEQQFGKKGRAFFEKAARVNGFASGERPAALKKNARITRAVKALISAMSDLPAVRASWVESGVIEDAPDEGIEIGIGAVPGDQPERLRRLRDECGEIPADLEALFAVLDGLSILPGTGDAIGPLDRDAERFPICPLDRVELLDDFDGSPFFVLGMHAGIEYFLWTPRDPGTYSLPWSFGHATPKMLAKNLAEYLERVARTHGVID